MELLESADEKEAADGDEEMAEVELLFGEDDGTAEDDEEATAPTTEEGAAIGMLCAPVGCWPFTFLKAVWLCEICRSSGSLSASLLSSSIQSLDCLPGGGPGARWDWDFEP